ncbi:MAG TPA: type II toxin-antitoxin system RelE/ParE family toxin [Longimicrobium sp.]
MAYRVVWPHYALADLDDIAEYIARDSGRAALRVVDDILAAGDRLSAFPLSGGVVDAYGLESVRQIFAGEYRVVYEIEDDVVEIWMVIHTCRRFPPRVIEDRKRFSRKRPH